MSPPTSQTAAALVLLRELARTEAQEQGYVSLQAAAYRAHHLLARACLAHSEPGDVVFEGGVSSGYFAELLTRAGRIVDGLELDPDAARVAERTCRKVYVGDLQAFDAGVLEQEYRLLVFGDTLEHIVDPVSVLARLRTKLVPGGQLVVSVPNIANWTIRLSLLAGRFRYTDRGILDRTHVRFYTRATLLEMLEQAGFTPVSVEAAVPVPGVTGPRLGRVTHWIGNRWSSLFAYNLIVVARAT